MSDENKKTLEKLAVGASFGFFFGVIGYVCMFLFRIIVAKNLGAEQFGQYTLIETILKILFIVVLLGIHSGITRYVPIYLHQKKYGKLQGYLKFSFGVPFFFSLVVALLVVLFSDNLMSYFNIAPELKIGIFIVAALLPIKVITSGLRKLFVAKKKILYREISQNIVEKGTLLLGAVVIVLFNLSIQELLIVLFLSSLASFIYMVIVYKTKMSFPRAKKSVYSFGSWINFSVPLFFSTLFAYVIGWSDNIILAKFLTFEDLGIYAVAFSIGALIGFFQSSFATIFVPLISEYSSKKQSIYPIFKKASSWIFGLSITLFFFMVLYSKELLQLFFGKEFIAGSAVLIIISIGMLVNVATGLSSSILVLHKKTWFIFFLNACFAIANIILNIILIPKLGIVGSANASAISVGCINLMFLWYASRFERIGFDAWYIIKFFCATALAGLISRVLYLKLFSINTINLVIVGVIYAISTVALLILFKPFDQEDIDIVELLEKKLSINLSLIKNLITYSK